VKGLYTYDGTPVLDIKPYLPYYDSKPDAHIAGWVSDLAKFFLTGQLPT
jgi:tRNA (Thr-GGU) A37 N-methylase